MQYLLAAAATATGGRQQAFANNTYVAAARSLQNRRKLALGYTPVVAFSQLPKPIL
jgi:hypothetical protein